MPASLLHSPLKGRKEGLLLTVCACAKLLAHKMSHTHTTEPEKYPE